MNESELAISIADKVVRDTNFWIAMVGLLGGVVGSLLTLLGNYLLHRHQTSEQRELEASQIKMLREMLDDDRFPDKWRSIGTLSAVIGEDEATTKRLLFKAKARGSEKNDGMWGLIKNHPLPGAADAT